MNSADGTRFDRCRGCGAGPAPASQHGHCRTPTASVVELPNPNVVKVVCDGAGLAQYFVALLPGRVTWG